MSNEPTLTAPAKAPHLAWRFERNNEPIFANVIGTMCECGQVIWTATGLMLDVKVNEGMDLIAKCTCGKTYSISEQNKVQAELIAQAEALQKQQAADAQAEAERQKAAAANPVVEKTLGPLGDTSPATPAATVPLADIQPDQLAPPPPPDVPPPLPGHEENTEVPCAAPPGSGIQ